MTDDAEIGPFARARRPSSAQEARATRPRPWTVYSATACLSMLASFWAVWLDPVINTDGTLYVGAAESIGSGDFARAMSIYPWPFYPALISGVSAAIGTSAETAAHVVNAGLYALISAGFVAVVRQMGGRGATLVAAAVLVLAAAPLNEQRSLVIRDGGAIAFQLFGLVALMRFAERPSWSLSLAWGGAMTVATLFRPESILLLCLAPTVLLFALGGALSRRWMGFLRAHAVLIVLSASLIALALLAPDSSAWEAVRSSRLSEPLSLVEPFTRIVTRTLPNRAEAVSESLFGEPDAPFGGLLVGVGLSAVVIVAFFQALTVPHALLAFHAFFSRSFRPESSSLLVWVAFVTLHLVILGAVAILNFELTDRSPLFLALLFSVPSAFSLSALYRGRCEEPGPSGGRKSWKNRAVLVVLAVMLCVTAVDGIVAFGTTKDHLRNAGLWIQQNTPANAALFTNDTTVGHYARRSDPWSRGPIEHRAYRPWDQVLDILRSDRWSKYDVLAIRIRRDQSEMEDRVVDLLGRVPLETFREERGGRVLVFRPGQTR